MHIDSMNNLIQLESGHIVAPFSILSGVKASAFVSSVVYLNTDTPGGAPVQCDKAFQ